MRSLLPIFAGSMPLLSLIFLAWHAPGASAEEPQAKGPDGLPREQTKGPAIRLPLIADRYSAVHALAFSTDGSTLAVAGGHGIVRFYNPATAREHAPSWDARTKEAIHGMAYAPDDAHLAVGIYDRVVVLETALSHPVLTLRIPAPPRPQDVAIQTVAYAPGGKAVAAAGYNGQVEVWDVATGEIKSVMEGLIVPNARKRGDGKIHGRAAHVRELAYAPDGKTLAAGADDGVVRLWDPAGGTARTQLDPTDPKEERCGPALAYSPDGSLLATSSSRRHLNAETSITLWDTATWKRRAVLHLANPGDNVTRLRFLPGGTKLVSLHAERNPDRTSIWLWDIATGKILDGIRFERHSLVHYELALSPDGQLLAAGGYESDPMFGAVELVEVEGNTLRHRNPAP